MFKLELKRREYTLKSTQGELYLNGAFFCYTLEDVSRGENIKIGAETAIPTGEYMVKVSMSNRFKRSMPALYSETDGVTLKNKGVSFRGIRMHGGNTHEHSEGCILVAHNLISADKIQGSAEKQLTKELQLIGGSGTITIENT